MSEHALIQLASIITLGILAQWLAWRFHLPSILLLLLFGFFAGPITHLIDPDTLFGDLLFPLVSISVAIILFEGGMSLRLQELQEVGSAVRNLITLGALVTFMVIAVAAYYFLQLDIELALLLGGILTVTGPTVVLPLLRQIRPTERVSSILKWEGILIDPIGAILALLIFEGILLEHVQAATPIILLILVKTILIGILLGGLGAGTMIWLLRRHRIPDFLQNPMALVLVVALFAVSNLFQDESGLLTVTLMGVILANQKYVTVKHIIEFKEILRVLLISSLFILLAARLKLETLAIINTSTFIFLGAVILVARPLAVFISTLFSRLPFREKLLISWLAPRGIVAAAVSSVFAIYLQEAGFSQAERLVSVTFLTIIATITVYGLTAPFLAKKLGLSYTNPQGLLFLGAHFWARKLAKLLSEEGIPVLLVDSNLKNIQLARGMKLCTYHGNGLSENVLEEVDLTGIGRMLAITSNDEVNSLATLFYADVFSSRDVYQLSPSGNHKAEEDIASELTGRILFSPEATFGFIQEKIQGGFQFRVVPLTDTLDYASFKQSHPKALPLFVITPDRQLLVVSVGEEVDPAPGARMVVLMPDQDAA